MATTKDFLALGAQALNLDDELALLKKLSDLADNWSAIAKAAKASGSAADFVDLLVDAPTDERVTAVLTAMGDLGVPALAEASAWLKDHLKDFADKTGALKKSLGPLVQSVTAHKEKTVDEDPGLCALKLPALAGGGNVGSVHLDLSAQARFELESGALWPFSDTDMQTDDRFVRFGFIGEAKAQAGAKLPFSYGSVSTDNKADAGLDIEYYFQPDANDQTVLAVRAAEWLPKIPSPFDFTEIAEAFRDRHFAGLVMRPSGKAALKVNVVVGADFELIKGVKTTVGLTVDADVTYSSDYTLSLRRKQASPDGILVVLSRTQLSGKRLASGLTVEVDLSTVVKRVHEIVQDYAKWSDGVLKDITPYLSPGTWLRKQAGDLVKTELQALIGDGEFAKAVALDAEALFRGGDTTNGIDWLTNEITGAIDQVGGVLTDRTDSAADTVAKAVVEKLGERFSTLLSVEDVKSKVTERIKTLIKEVQDRFAAQASGLSGAAAKDVADLLTSLQLKIATAGDAADKALENVRRLVERYDAAIKMLLDKTAEGVDSRVKLAITSEEQRWDGKGYEIYGVFRPKHADAARLYSVLLNGKLDEMKSLLLDPSDALEIVAGKSRISVTAGGSDKKALDLVVLGFPASASSLIKGEATTVIDGAGNIQVASRADAEYSAEGLGELMKLNFFDVWSVAASRSLPGVGSGQIGFGFSYKDNKLKRSELEQLLGSLQKSDLISTKAVTDGLAILADNFKTGGNNALPVSLAGKLQLTDGQFERLMTYADLLFQPGAADYGPTIFAYGVQALVDTGYLTADALHLFQTIMAEQPWNSRPANTDFHVRALSFVEFMDANPDRLAIVRTDRAGLGAVNAANFDLGYKALEMATALVRVFRKLGSIRAAVGRDDWNAGKFRDRQRELAKEAAKWLTVKSDALLWIRPEVSQQTRAFLRAMLAAASDHGAPHAPGGPLRIEMTIKNDSGSSPAVSLG